MKICAISDLHGYLPKIEPCELVLICGDIVSLHAQRYPKSCKEWYIDWFVPWVNELPCDKVLFIPGNHEVGMEGHEDFYKNYFGKHHKATILIHDYYEYFGTEGKFYKIFGTPYCKIFGNWAYMRPNSDLKEKFSEIPEGLDILLTHDAPFGVSDILLQERYYTGEHIGNKPLAEAILQKAPKIVCHGHLHSTSREFEELGYSKVVNCSIKDEHYNPIYSPIVFEL